MNLLFRFFSYLLVSLTRARMDILDVSILTFFVLPNDLDFNGHMNNGRYLTLMDIARTDLIVRCGLGKAVLKNGWKPMIASQMIRFRKGLRPFQKFQIHTKVVGWNERYTFLEQKFVQAEKIVSVAIVKASFVGPKGPVPSNDLHAASGSKSTTPELPPYVSSWQKSEEDMRAAAF